MTMESTWPPLMRRRPWSPQSASPLALACTRSVLSSWRHISGSWTLPWGRAAIDLWLRYTPWMWYAHERRAVCATRSAKGSAGGRWLGGATLEALGAGSASGCLGAARCSWRGSLWRDVSLAQYHCESRSEASCDQRGEPLGALRSHGVAQICIFTGSGLGTFFV